MHDRPASSPPLEPPGLSTAPPPTRLSVPARALLALAASTLLLSPLVILYAWREALIDDAFITWRYSQNLIEGLGLNFNPGERVEGYTSLLHVLLCALPLSIGLPAPVFAQGLNLLAALGTLFLTWRLARGALRLPPVSALLAPALLLANLNLLAWTAHGLETPVFAFLILAAVAAVARGLQGPCPDSAASHLAPEAGSRSGRLSPTDGPAGITPPSWLLLAGLLCGLATLTRPEGLLYGGLTALYAAWGRLNHRPDPTRLPTSATPRALLASLVYVLGPEARLRLPLLLFLLPVAVQYLGRYAYYGVWLPNTFFAKASGGAGQLDIGLAYARAFLGQGLLGGFGLLLLLPAARRLRQGPRGLFLVFLVFTIGYTIRVGGDSFMGARFYVPVLAPLALLMADGLDALLKRGRLANFLALLAFLSISLWSVAATGAELARQARIATAMTRNRVFAGKVLQAITPPDTWLALNTVGALPFYAHRPAIDMYGLTDAHIGRLPVRPAPGGGTGHEKGDGAYVLSRRPGLILLRNVWISDVPIEAHRSVQGVSERELVRHPGFAAAYRPVNLILRPGLYFGFYLRADLDPVTLLSRFQALDLRRLGPVEGLTPERGAEVLLVQEGNRHLVAADGVGAERAFRKALTFYPGMVEAWLGLGHALGAQGRLSESTAAYARAVELAPTSSQAQLWLGRGLALEQRLEAAEAALREALRLDSRSAEGWDELAAVLIRLNRLEEAQRALLEATRLAPRDGEQWLRLAAVALAGGDLPVARQALEKARGLVPLHPRLADLSARLGAAQAGPSGK